MKMLMCTLSDGSTLAHRPLGWMIWLDGELCSTYVVSCELDVRFRMWDVRGEDVILINIESKGKHASKKQVRSTRSSMTKCV